MRGSIALRKTIAIHPRMIGVVAATMAACLALLGTIVVSLVGASTASAASTTFTIKDFGTLPNAKCLGGSTNAVNIHTPSGEDGQV